MAQVENNAIMKVEAPPNEIITRGSRSIIQAPRTILVVALLHLPEVEQGTHSLMELLLELSRLYDAHRSSSQSGQITHIWGLAWGTRIIVPITGIS